MKLYYSPGACSLASHIALREAGLTFEPVRVDLHAKKTADGEDFTRINPKGYVPALLLDDGTLLTEGPAILQYIADRKPESQLAPPAGTLERYRLQEWLGFISSELHKSFSLLFNPATPEEFKSFTRERIGARYAWVEQGFGAKSFLLGEAFTVADAYLFTVTKWAKRNNIELSRWPTLQRWFDRVSARHQVQEAMKAEGLGVKSESKA